MKIAVTSTGPTLDNDIEARFGRCAYFLIIDPDTMPFEAIENPNIALGGGAGIQSAQLMSEKGVTIVLTGNCGPNAFSVFGQAGIQVVAGISGNIYSAVEQYQAGNFASADGPNLQSHFGIGSGQQPKQVSSPNLVNNGMDNPGLGMARGGGRGRCMGGGIGMGQGMGMGMRTAMPGSPASFDVFQSNNISVGNQSELEQLKQQSQILQKQKQEIDNRISELESGRKAAAFVQTDKCNGCGICTDVCPAGAISINEHAFVNPRLCTACVVCVSECPNGAITITQQKIGS